MIDAACNVAPDSMSRTPAARVVPVRASRT